MNLQKIYTSLLTADLMGVMFLYVYPGHTALTPFSGGMSAPLLPRSPPTSGMQAP